MRTGVVVILSVVGLLTASPPTRGQANGSPQPGLPKVVLVGDSIRLGYASRVAERLAGKAVMISPAENGGDSANVLAHLDEWVLKQKPDVVHLNCGLHDLKRSKTNGHHQVELDRYAENLRRIVTRIRAGTDATLVFASATPILDERHAKRGADFDRIEADVRRYNATASMIMGELGVPVHDLHWVVEQGGPESMLGPDGTHYTPAGSDRLAEAVADCVLRRATMHRYRPLLRPASGPRATENYRKAAAQRDSLVPAAYRQLKVGEFRIPANASTWKEQRPTILRTVVDSLGDLPPRPSPPRARIISRELHPGYTLEKVSLANGVDGQVTALMLVPADRKRPLPAILWLACLSARQTESGTGKLEFGSPGTLLVSRRALLASCTELNVATSRPTIHRGTVRCIYAAGGLVRATGYTLAAVVQGSGQNGTCNRPNGSCCTLRSDRRMALIISQVVF